jgi:ubiquinone/menaquinone biosynthesis C-methylase UbiE
MLRSVKLEFALRFLVADADGIYDGIVGQKSSQEVEIKLREDVAAIRYKNYLETIAKSHSIPVMDMEIRNFLNRIPKDGIILDIGGCWGWHWRFIGSIRPDVSVVIVDFVRANFIHAKNILGNLVGTQIALLHANATSLPIFIDSDFQGFDGVWTVQTFQHIPNFNAAISGAYRVLNKSGEFSCYSLNIQPHIKFFKKILFKRYISEGWVEGSFYLSRSNTKQKLLIEKVFKNKVTERWTEILFRPELYFWHPGRVGSFLGWIDTFLSSNNFNILGWLARQRSYHVRKS